MNDTVRWASGQQPAREPRGDSANLADILERVLDKGIVIAGDIQVNLLDIELLTIKIRLVVASVDRAKEMGIDWWERDPTLSAGRDDLENENARLRERVEALEATARREGLPVAAGDDLTDENSPDDDPADEDSPDDMSDGDEDEADEEPADEDRPDRGPEPDGSTGRRRAPRESTHRSGGTRRPRKG